MHASKLAKVDTMHMCQGDPPPHAAPHLCILAAQENVIDDLGLGAARVVPQWISARSFGYGIGILCGSAFENRDSAG